MANIPNNKGKKIPSKKAPVGKKEFSLSDFKKQKNLDNMEEKPMEWLEISSAFKEATGFAGFPKGYVSLSRGFSNTGKSTSACEAAVAAQKMGILPIIIDTENNIGTQRLEKMGFDFSDDFYIYIDNDYLLENFGKHQNKNRTQATIEDMAQAIYYFLDLQDNDQLPFEFCFIIDSLGTLDCIRTVDAYDKGSSENNMWNAGAFEHSFKDITNNRIPSSRKVKKKYTNTLIAVQKIWIDSMGSGVVKHKGGEAFFYAARFIVHSGGIVSHSTKKVSATSKNKEVSFGIETKIYVVKNQIDDEKGGTSLEGKIVSTPHGYIGADKDSINEYKKQNIQFFRDALGTDVSVDELGTKYTTIKNEDDNSTEASINDFNRNLEEFESESKTKSDESK